MKYFVCNCFYESKLGYGIESIKKFTLKDFGFKYVTSVKNDCCYICCRETIKFLFEYYCNSNFYPLITGERKMVKTDDEDIYLLSEEAIFFHFSSSLLLFGEGPV